MKANPKVIAAIVAAGLTVASPSLYDFLGRWEGKSEYVVYADKLAGGLPTVCRGLTRHVTDTPIVVGQRWTPEKCRAEEEAAITLVQTQLFPCFVETPPQWVFDAASSHAWNFGAGRTCASAAMRAWKAGDWVLGCRRLRFGDDGRDVWVFAGGNRTPGLVNRRDAERLMCEGRA